MLKARWMRCTNRTAKSGKRQRNHLKTPKKQRQKPFPKNPQNNKTKPTNNTHPSQRQETRQKDRGKTGEASKAKRDNHQKTKEMPKNRKYTEPTRPITMTFYTKDIDTLQAHATHRETVTDLVQEAIKDLIRRRGWETDGGPETKPPTFKVTLEPTPQPNYEVTEDNSQEDNGLPEWLMLSKKAKPKPPLSIP